MLEVLERTATVRPVITLQHSQLAVKHSIETLSVTRSSSLKHFLHGPNVMGKWRCDQPFMAIFLDMTRVTSNEVGQDCTAITFLYFRLFVINWKDLSYLLH